MTFSGFGGHRVRGWLRMPAARSGPLPCVVQYIGYGGGRGLAHENLLWAAAGYANFVMDTRGQGSANSVGDTGDPVFSGPAHPGFMTRGILDPATYYYRRLYTDAVRAVDAARAHEAVANAVAVTGGSQGGGLALAVAALRDDIVAAMPDVPFLRGEVGVCVPSLGSQRLGTSVSTNIPLTEDCDDAADCRTNHADPRRFHGVNIAVLPWEIETSARQRNSTALIVIDVSPRRRCSVWLLRHLRRHLPLEGTAPCDRPLRVDCKAQRPGTPVDGCGAVSCGRSGSLETSIIVDYR